MKQLLLTVLLSALYFLLSAQPCGSTLLSESVTINNFVTKHKMYRVGSLESTEDDMVYRHPNGLDSIRYHDWKGLWAGGIDSSGVIHVAASTYSTGGVDYLAGPLPQSGYSLDPSCDYYTRIWKVTADQLAKLKSDFENGQLGTHNIPKDILEWPTENNPWMGEFAPDYEMAPYLDRNNDNIYNPLDGDYPIALVENPEFVPYEMLFTVFNDKSSAIHGETGGNAIGLEVHQLDYVTRCDPFSVLDNSTFTRLKYIYRGDQELKGFRIGIWQDASINGFNMGSGYHQELAANYTYQLGRVFAPSPEPDYKNIQSLMYLSHTPQSSLIYFNASAGDSGCDACHEPAIPEDFYNYLNGIWKDGTPLVTGGIGHTIAGGGQDTTLFSFPDLPNDPNGWSMLTSVVGSLDGRSVTSLVHTDLQPGDQGIIDYVDHMYYDTNSLNLEIFERWPALMEELRAEFESIKNGQIDCVTTSIDDVVTVSPTLFPNPAIDRLTINLDDAKFSELEIHDLQGRRMMHKQISHANQAHLDIEHLDSGFYSLRIIDENNQLHRVTFIKH